MATHQQSNQDSVLKSDFTSSIVLFLVALPLCLGIAVASDAPLMSGVIAGIFGGIFISSLTKSPLAIAGPAAGMSIIVANGIYDLGPYENFLFAVVVAGAMQMILGLLGFARLGHLIPSSVIKGMTASIGLVLLFKQIPHGLGYDISPEGEESFFSADENTITQLYNAISNIHPGAFIIFILGLVILYIIQKPYIQKLRYSNFLVGPLFVVIVSVLLNLFFMRYVPDLALTGDHLVRIPDMMSGSIGDILTFPNFSEWKNPEVYKIALIVAMVGSVETLAGLEAIEKLDPYKRIVPLGYELRLQGLGNFIVGCIGGLPMTTVIIRGSANIAAGAKTRLSAIFHGIWLFIFVFFLVQLINSIPLAALASILVKVGYRLTDPRIYTKMLKEGSHQFVPYIVTIIAVFFSDLLIGLGIGVVVGTIYTVRVNFHNSIVTTQDKSNFLVKLAKDVSFLNKGRLREVLYSIPKNSYVIIDGTKPMFIDKDIVETIAAYQQMARLRGITVELKYSETSANDYFMKKRESV